MASGVPARWGIAEQPHFCPDPVIVNRRKGPTKIGVLAAIGTITEGAYAVRGDFDAQKDNSPRRRGRGFFPVRRAGTGSRLSQGIGRGLDYLQSVRIFLRLQGRGCPAGDSQPHAIAIFQACSVDPRCDHELLSGKFLQQQIRMIGKRRRPSAATVAILRNPALSVREIQSSL